MASPSYSGIRKAAEIMRKEGTTPFTDPLKIAAQQAFNFAADMAFNVLGGATMPGQEPTRIRPGPVGAPITEADIRRRTMVEALSPVAGRIIEGTRALIQKDMPDIAPAPRSPIRVAVDEPETELGAYAKHMTQPLLAGGVLVASYMLGRAAGRPQQVGGQPGVSAQAGGPATGQAPTGAQLRADPALKARWIEQVRAQRGLWQQPGTSLAHAAPGGGQAPVPRQPLVPQIPPGTPPTAAAATALTAPVRAAAAAAARLFQGPQDNPELRTAAQEIVRDYHHGSAGDIAKRSVETANIVRKLPKKRRSDLIFFIDTGLVSGDIKATATRGNLFKPGDTTAKLKRRMTPALKAKAAAIEQHLNEVHQERADMLRRAGIDTDDPVFIEDYVTHFYEVNPADIEGVKAAFRTRNPLDKKRTYETFQEAFDASQGRLRPKFETVEEYVALHDAYNIRAAYGLQLVDKLSTLQGTTALPLVVPPAEAPQDWPRSNHWVWRQFAEKPIGVLQGKRSEFEYSIRHKTTGKRLRVAATEQEARDWMAEPPPAALKMRGVDPDDPNWRDQWEVAKEPARGKRVVRKGPVEVAVNPIVWDHFRSVFGKPLGPGDTGGLGIFSKTVRASAAVNRFVKRVNTVFSPFHAIELGISGIPTERLGPIAAPVHVWKLLAAGTKLRDPDFMKDAVGHGLVVDLPGDVQTGVNWMTKKAAAQAVKGHKATAAALRLLNLPFKPGDWFTWKVLYTREKVVGYENMVKQVTRIVDRGKKKGHYQDWDEDRIKREAARITNDILGGLDNKTMAVMNDPKTRQMMNALAYAWDWTHSTFRQGIGAFRGGPGGKARRKWWGKMAVGLGALYQIVNMYTTKRDFGEARFTWENPDEGSWWKIYIGKDDAGRNQYISVGKQIPEFIRWFTNSFGQAWSKLAVIPRVIGEQWRGVRPQGGILPESLGGKPSALYPVEPGPQYEPFEGGLPSRLHHIWNTVVPFVANQRRSFAGSFPKSGGLTGGKAAHEFREAWERFALTGNEKEQAKRFARIAVAMDANELGDPVTVSEDSNWVKIKVAKKVGDQWQVPAWLDFAARGRAGALQRFSREFWTSLARRGKGAARRSVKALTRLGWTQEDALRSLPAKVRQKRIREYRGKIVLYDRVVPAERIREALSWFPSGAPARETGLEQLRQRLPSPGGGRAPSR